MDKREALRQVAIELGMRVITAHCIAKQCPTLVELGESITARMHEIARALDFDIEPAMEGTIARVCGLNCETCKTPMA